VDNFVPDIDRRAVLGDRALDDFDGAINACAETARGSDDQPDGR
jgi:hypothetical protein